MLNFRVRDLDAMLAQLRGKGADVADEIQDMAGVGRFGKDRSKEALRSRFRNSVKSEHRVQKPLWENKVGGGVIGSLNVSRRLEGGGETELGLLLPSDADVEATVLGQVPDDRPLSQVMAKLTSTEREIALLFASGQSWKEAAVSVGQPESAGWNVCRKLKRSMKDLVDRQQRRQRTLAARQVA
ncbi:VOC family protein [Amycolatopsis sp. cmx-4-68]|uniref:VOC family protein n=1 Tax=Amycolatopsis sp. cmx-4-68 TaxID=2790938 RepID=UPI00397CDA38